MIAIIDGWLAPGAVSMEIISLSLTGGNPLMLYVKMVICVSGAGELDCWESFVGIVIEVVSGVGLCWIGGD